MGQGVAVASQKNGACLFVVTGESESYDLDPLIDLFFGKVLAVKFNE